MNKEAKTIVKKTAKIAGVTCVALGGAALIASGAALKALTEGAKYLKDTLQRILEDPAEAEIILEAEAEEKCAEASVDVPAVETVDAEEAAAPVESGDPV